MSTPFDAWRPGTWMLDSGEKIPVRVYRETRTYLVIGGNGRALPGCFAVSARRRLAKVNGCIPPSLVIH